MTLPTIEAFFKPLAKDGHIFPAPGLRVRLRNGLEAFDVMMIAPEYVDIPAIRIYDDTGTKRWDMAGKAFAIEGPNWKYSRDGAYDITAILDESGAVIAGEA